MGSFSLIICPVYNEQNTLLKFYDDLRDNYSGDVIFVDDGSIDKSKDILEDFQSNVTFLKRHDHRFGYGAALMSGFDFARSQGYKKVVTIDVDLQHKPEQIPLFLEDLEKWDVVLGSRYISISKSLDVPRTRLAINRYISKLIKVLFSTEFTDPFCGLRGYRTSFLDRIKLKNQSYGIGIEILLELIKVKANFREVAIETIYFKDIRKFLDGLDDPRRRLFHYLEVISRKKRELINEEEISIYKPSSR